MLYIVLLMFYIELFIVRIEVFIVVTIGAAKVDAIETFVIHLLCLPLMFVSCLKLSRLCKGCFKTLYDMITTSIVLTMLQFHREMEILF
jgi:hypothetical protein